jgi:hypothetical protein
MHLTVGDLLDALRPMPLWFFVLVWLIGSLLGGVSYAAVKELWQHRGGRR